MVVKVHKYNSDVLIHHDNLSNYSSVLGAMLFICPVDASIKDCRSWSTH